MSTSYQPEAEGFRILMNLEEQIITREVDEEQARLLLQVANGLISLEGYEFNDEEEEPEEQAKPGIVVNVQNTDGAVETAQAVASQYWAVTNR